MENISKLIRERRSVRSFDGRSIDPAALEALLRRPTDNPYEIPVTYKLLPAAEHGLNCPVVSGTELYLGGKLRSAPHANEAFGYSFEALILHAQSMGLGTTWLGGTMNRAAYEKAMELAADEMMPCATPLGYAAKKMSIKESLMRKAIRADERLPFESLFFRGDFDTPLRAEEAGELALPLEMVRLAPSAVNRQPWRLLVKDGAVHFYLRRSRVAAGANLDMQKIDMGIALCHFDLGAKEAGLQPRFSLADPGLQAEGLEYIASYIIM